MRALRSALLTLNRRSSGSSAAAYTGGRRQEIINKAFPRSSSAAAAPLQQPSAIRNSPKKGFRHFSTDVREPTGKAASGMQMWWHRATYPIHRIKHRMETADLQERMMGQYVYLVFSLGTATVFWVKTTRDIYYGV